MTHATLAPNQFILYAAARLGQGVRASRVIRFKQQYMSDKINELVKRRAELLEELSQVTREIEDAQTEVFRHIASQKVLVRRYFDGDMVVVSFDRFWWVNQDGDLLGTVDESDISELKTLTQSGIFERVTITH